MKQWLAPAHLAFLEQLTASIGIVLNSIEATMQTEGLLKQSQQLAAELQTQLDALRADLARGELADLTRRGVACRADADAIGSATGLVHRRDPSRPATVRPPRLRATAQLCRPAETRVVIGRISGGITSLTHARSRY